MKKKAYRFLLELASNRLISRLVGSFTKREISRRLIPSFVKAYSIEMDEAEKEIGEYTNLNELFTRRLKEGKRIVESDPNAVVSPVDAVITAAGPIAQDLQMKVKGQLYGLEEMFGFDRSLCRQFQGGQFIVLYLSPRHYHRIHFPVDGEVTVRRRIDGKVYPVNEFGLKYGKRPLSRNARLLTVVKHAFGEVAVMKVGALNVASIQYTFPDQLFADKGDELAYFEFGSTVVLFFEPGTFCANSRIQEGKELKMGEKIGEMINPKDKMDNE